MKLGWVVVVAIVCFLIGMTFGWGDAHRTVAKECERLGGFYVGKDVYKCVKVIEEMVEE